MPVRRKDGAREWVQARVDEFGTVNKAKPDDFTHAAWRALCQHYGVKSKRNSKARTLEDALQRVADLANS